MFKEQMKRISMYSSCCFHSFKPTAGDTVFKCCLQLSAQIFNYFELKSRVMLFCGKCPSGIKLLLFCRSFILWKFFSKVLKFNNVTSISISVAPFCVTASLLLLKILLNAFIDAISSTLFRYWSSLMVFQLSVFYDDIDIFCYFFFV